MPSVPSTTVPLLAAPTALTVSVSPASGPSSSLRSTSITLAPLSSTTVSLSLLAFGSSLTLVTVMETVAVLESKLPSFALKVKESVPL